MKQTWPSRIFAFLLVAAGAWAAVGCTIIRYVDDPNNDPDDGPPPKVVDLLVMMDMSRATANLAQEYGSIIGGVQIALATQNVTIRHSALAPLNARTGEAVPLLYGEGEENSEFFSIEEAVFFYTHDEGSQYLQDKEVSDAANLAILGRELDSRPIYHPTTADPDGSAYFSEPADGFVVLYFSATSRICGHSDADCEIEGQRPGDYFTSEDGVGVTWLELPGGGSLPADKVFHGAVVSAEEVEYEEFYEACSKQPNFPAAKLDIMAPSEHAYYGPLVEAIVANGGAAQYVDLCEAMSRRMELKVGGLAAGIRAMLNKP